MSAVINPASLLPCYAAKFVRPSATWRAIEAWRIWWHLESPAVTPLREWRSAKTVEVCAAIDADLDAADRTRGAALDDIVACARALNILSLAVDETLAAMDAAAERPAGLSEEGHRVRTVLHNARAEALAIVDAPAEAPNPRDPAGDPPVERPILSIEAQKAGT